MTEVRPVGGPLVLTARVGTAPDQPAFAELLRRHQGKVRGLLLRLASDRTLADDLAQEVFLRAYRGLAGFEGRARFSTWLYRIATTTALSHLRRERSLTRRAAACERDAELPLAAPPRAPLDAVTEAETARAVADLVAALAPPYREILALRYYDGKSERDGRDGERRDERNGSRGRDPMANRS